MSNRVMSSFIPDLECSNIDIDGDDGNCTESRNIPEPQDHVPQIHISIDQLEGIVDRGGTPSGETDPIDQKPKVSDLSESTRKARRRPDVALYKPSRLSSRRPADASEQVASKIDRSSTRSDHGVSLPEASLASLGRAKRPEQPKYVPKKRSQGTASATGDKEKTSGVVSNKTTDVISNKTTDVISNKTADVVSNESAGTLSNESAGTLSNESAGTLCNESAGTLSNEKAHTTVPFSLSGKRIASETVCNNDRSPSGAGAPSHRTLVMDSANQKRRSKGKGADKASLNNELTSRNGGKVKEAYYTQPSIGDEVKGKSRRGNGKEVAAPSDRQTFSTKSHAPVVHESGNLRPSGKQDAWAKSTHGAPTGKSTHGAPANKSTHGAPANKSTHGAPTGKSTHGAPTGKSTHGAPTGKSTHGTPTGKSTHGAPTGKSTHGAPTGKSTHGAPTGKSTHGAPANKSTHGAPTGKSTHGPPVKRVNNHKSAISDQETVQSKHGRKEVSFTDGSSRTTEWSEGEQTTHSSVDHGEGRVSNTVVTTEIPSDLLQGITQLSVTEMDAPSSARVLDAQSDLSTKLSQRYAGWSGRKERGRENCDNGRKLYDPYSHDQASTPKRVDRIDQLTDASIEDDACSRPGAGQSLHRYTGDGDYTYPSPPTAIPLVHSHRMTDDMYEVRQYPSQSTPAAATAYTYNPQHHQYYATDPALYSPQFVVGYNHRAPSAKQNKVTRMLQTVSPYEKQLSSLITSRQFSPSTLDHIHRLREKVKRMIESVLLVDLEYTSQHSVDQLLWKSVYHQLLEALRSYLQHGVAEDATNSTSNGSTSDVIHRHICEVLDDANATYSNLLTSLERQVGFDLSYYTRPHPFNQPSSRTLKLALIMAQRFLVCLGDVARYRTQNEYAAETTSLDYGKARRFYLQASRVAAKNGKPYNQLAIIAFSAKRKLDTVFYFMRSIAASNAFLSARETLRAIYSDIIKKYKFTKEEGEKRKLSLSTRNRKGKRGGIDEYHKRIELWISPIDGSSVTDHVDDALDVDNPRRMPCNELYRRLMNSFLSSQGFLFSKVGMEYLPESSSQLLHQMDALISHTPIPHLNSTILIHMFAIAMFSIQNAGTAFEGASLGTAEKCRSYTQEQAILLYIDMTTIIIQRCTVLLNNSSTHKQPISHLLSHDLSLLLPVVKLATDWMTCHPHLWNPPPCPRDPTLGPVLDPWLSIAQLTNALTQLEGLSSINFFTASDVDNNMAAATVSEPVPNPYTWLGFEEEIELRGFLPLMNLPSDDVYIKCDVQKELAAVCYRASRLITFADYLCGIEPAMLEYSTSTCKYRSVVEPPSMSEKTEIGVQQSTDGPENQWERLNTASDVSSEDEGVSCVNQSSSELDDLLKTKRHLSRQLAQQRHQQLIHQNVLNKESSSSIIQVEVRPLFLVPDTNCFIEYPKQMMALVTSLKFTVVVPLVVINELDGLSRGRSSSHSVGEAVRSQSLEHAESVGQIAGQIVEFLESQFERRNRRLKALTVTGTELHTITYRSEQQELSTDGNNDDRILSCCLHYCKDSARNFMPRDKDQTVRLYREVVLLTDDRNLRLKAHTRNVPVKDLIQFIEWSGLSSLMISG